MTASKRKPRWSFLLIRGPGQQVKRIQVSGKTVFIVPVAAALTIAGVIAGLELKSLYRIQELESLIARQSEQLSGSENGKDEEIGTLRQELASLNEQADDLKTRMQGLRELETKLRQFIGKQESALPGLTDDSYRTSSILAESSVAAAKSTEDGVSDESMASAIADFEELSELLDSLADTMASNLRKARQRQAEIESRPSGWPTVSRKLTSGFGYRRDPINGRSTFHAGIDISGDEDDPVFAAGSGTVKETGFNSSRGNYIIITHRSGLESWYMHLRRISVKTGAIVGRGEVIGRLGNTGRSTGPHLHFQVVVQDEPVSPLPYLRMVKED
ncbi:peptidoglycan DD-metalloendopeptidase family protein [Cohnella faecalis]|nr:peptidoglycan DD-metalloendopeptidase family protein [Cohnella faecalis]